MSATAMRHDFYLYGSDHELVAGCVPFVLAGLESDEPAIVVVARRKAWIVSDALGAAAAGVTFVVWEDFYTRPEAALAGYDATIRRLVRDGAPGVRVFGEVPFCRSDRDWDDWARYEAVLNRALEHHPVWIACGYDERDQPARAIDDARRTHPQGLMEPHGENADYLDPASVVRALTPAPEPLRDLREVPHGDSPRAAREQLALALRDAGLGDGKADGVLLAAGEVLANATRHGGGVAAVRVGRVNGQVVCEIADRGTGIDDPLAGYLPPRPHSVDGAGLWVARQLTDRLELTTTPGGGLTVRLWT